MQAKSADLIMAFQIIVVLSEKKQKKMIIFTTEVSDLVPYNQVLK